MNRAAWWVLALAALFVVLGAAELLGSERWDTARGDAADLEINYVAVYGRGFAFNDDTFTSFIGPPTTALVYAPFTAFGHEVASFRWAPIACMVASVAVVSSVLPSGSRLLGALGAWSVIGWLVIAAGLAAIVAVSRRRAFHPLELGAVIVVALLAGPVRWDHLPVWGVLTFVLVADPRLWSAMPIGGSVLVGVALLASAIAFTQNPALYGAASLARLRSGAGTIGLLALLVAVTMLLAARQQGAEPVEREPSMPDDARAPRPWAARDSNPEPAGRK